MQKRTVRILKVATLAAVPLVILWATPTPPVARTGAPGETTCSACHGGAGGTGSVVVSSTSGMTSYTPGASKHFTVTVTGSGGNAGFELTARPASNLSGGVAGNFVPADSTTGVTCQVGTTGCAAGNPQYIRSMAATATPAVFNFDWTAPTGSENVTLYLASVVGYSGNTYTATYTLSASGGTAPTLSVTPASLSFNYQTGGTAPAAQTLAISGAATTYTAAASGGTWLAVSPASGGTSGSASASINTTGLTAGSYSGSVVVTAAGSTGSPKSIPVTLNVTAAAPTLTVTPASLSFVYQTGGTAPAAQTLAISGVASTYMAAPSGGTWLSVTPASGGTSGSASVSVNTTGLAAGTYNGSVTITAAGSTGSPKSTPVTLTVTAQPTITASPATLDFAYQTGGTAPAAQTISVGGTAKTYSVAVSGGTWLSATPAGGSTPGSVSVSVNSAGVAAGTYTGSVTITSAGAAGSPLAVPVTFTVSAQTSLTVSPTTMAFNFQTGGTAPAAQTVTLGSSGTALKYTTAVSGGAWLSATPASGTTPAGVSVSVKPAGLAAGTYTGSVTITSAGAAASPQTVAVNFVVTAPTLTVSPSSLSFAYQVGGAAPAAQRLAIGGVATTFSASANGGTWLAVSPTSGGTASATVSINTSGMQAGTFSGSIRITAAGSLSSPITVPVSFTVTPAAPTLTASPAALTFAAQTGGAAPAAQTIALSAGSLAYTVTAAGGTWLTVSPSSGTAPGNLSVSVNTTGMVAGAYSGTLTIAAPGSLNGSLTIAVGLKVTDPVPTLQINPKTLSFGCAAGNTPPIPFVINMASSTSATLHYNAVVSGGAWLSVVPATGSTPGAIFVSANPAGLAVGTYNASLTLTSDSPANAPQTIPVTLAVSAATNSCPVSGGN